MLKNPSPQIEDQNTDRSGAVLTKIASRLRDRKLASLALDTLFDHEREFAKEASFPTNSAKDVFLSRIYFEGQREKLAADEAKALDERLATYEALYGLQTKVAFGTASLNKTAGEIHELLPNCKIASKEELVQAGNDFSAQFSRLELAERRSFAENFVKAAQEFAVEAPSEVNLHAGVGVEANPALPEHLLMRKLALDRRGKNSSAYELLHRKLAELNSATYSLDELAKLAEALEEADLAYAVRKSGPGKNIPDAWHSVFQVKQAEDAQDKTPAESLSKADIVSRYGEGILEEVENDTGEIDQPRLKKLLSTLEQGTKGQA